MQQSLDVQLLQDIKQAASTLAWVYNMARVIIALEQGCAACSSEKYNLYIQYQDMEWFLDRTNYTECTLKVHNKRNEHSEIIFLCPCEKQNPNIYQIYSKHTEAITLNLPWLALQ